MFYSFAKWVVGLFFTLFFRLRVEGLANLPRTGGAVIAANHASYLDPPAVGVSLPRRLFFMAKAELFRVPIFGGVLRRLGAFPVHRAQGDRAALRTALAHLRAGEWVGIFPQGGRAANTDLRELRLGAALLSAQAGVPLVPVAVVGSDWIWGKGRLLPRLGRLVVRVGEPLPPPPAGQSDRETLRRQSERLAEALQRLLQADPGGRQG